MALKDKECIPCRGGVPPLTEREIEPFIKELADWQVIEGKKIRKEIKFDDFAQSMEMANRIAELAEREGHHPDLLVRWGELVIEIWTHKVDGLTESDFILAAKIDDL